MSELRVLHVISTFADSYGGPVTACRDLCRELASRGMDVSILTTTWDGRRDVAVSDLKAPEGVRLVAFPTRPPRGWWFSPELSVAIAREVAAHDLVHVHMLYAFPPNCAAYWSHRRGVPYVIHPHGCLHPWVRTRHPARKRVHEWLFERKTVGRAEAVFYTAEEERRLSTGFADVREIVVPLGVDVPDLRREEARAHLERRWPELRGRKVVLFLGRLHEKKGLDVLVRAFQEIHRKRAELSLLVAGPDDGLAASLEAWIREAGIGDHTHVVGMLRGADKTAALGGSDVFVLPSQAENFALAVAEAMAHALPVVISDQINIWREIDEAGAGIVIPARDPGSLAQALERVLTSQGLAREMGARGRALVEQRFSWREIGTRMVELYHEAAASRASRGH